MIPYLIIETFPSKKDICMQPWVTRLCMILRGVTVHSLSARMLRLPFGLYLWVSSMKPSKLADTNQPITTNIGQRLLLSADDDRHQSISACIDDDRYRPISIDIDPTRPIPIGIRVNRPISTKVRWYSQLLPTENNQSRPISRHRLISAHIHWHQLTSLDISWYRQILVDIASYP